MKITFLIGNGFDIGLNMPTRYEDFYRHYCKIREGENGDTVNIFQFKTMLKERNDDKKKKIIDWADFEKAFGEHSSELTSARKADYLARFDDFVERFNSYLEIVESCTDYSNTDELGKAMDAAVKSYKHIRRADENTIDNFLKQFSSERIYNFVCFNYTKALDHCIGALRGALRNDNQRRVGSIIHIHGYIETNMIVGVNDPSQITDPELAKDEEVIRHLVKPAQNDLARTAYEDDLIAVINQSDLICIYGMSLGETDKKWWDMIATWLTKSDKKLLLILNHDTAYTARFPHKQDQVIRPLRDRFLSYSALSDDVKKQLESRILIGINNDVFSMNLFNSVNFEDAIKKWHDPEKTTVGV